ncbi:metalloregulator ArsR/SmtB family transcription factor [Kineosporia sp. NBRC 101731]|uniref:ArsR/SmtB family transcription factor n=1 Tax=Kineosporia sp. NBRC 101731 TaxID=3032199 RepID=UPI0024A2FC11|nr:metalloregulator ArsR/SmtB family transcription factor [Kineosporia sp. NBRC 101731]GLY33869.1 transcriptional regulator [Kineosporia sp. NBRC 101731]
MSITPAITPVRTLPLASRTQPDQPQVDVEPGAACCAPLARQPLDAQEAAKLARTLKAIADPARLRLLSLVAAHEGGEACVCDLIEPLGLSQPTVSHHLKVLVEAGLLTRDKRGVWAYFTLVPEALNALAAVLVAPVGISADSVG